MVNETFTPLGFDRASPGRRVLLVDEDPADLRTLRLVLEGQGYEVRTHSTHEEGVRCLEAEPFDFVVVSQGSQAFEGRKVLDRAAQLDRQLPVLVVTRCIDMHCYLEAMQMGAIDYLEKPVPPADLVGFVRAHASFEPFKMQAGAA